MSDDHRRGVSDIRDEEVRNMLIRAGVDVERETDVLTFARMMRWMFERHEAFVARKARQGAVIVAVVTSLVTLTIGATGPTLWHYFFK